jgi:hypothetical protein
MMLVSAVAIDNADISDEAKEAIKRWRSDRNEQSQELKELADSVNAAINAHLEARFTRRIKSRGRYQTSRT